MSVHADSYERFRELGWPALCRRLRRPCACNVYAAIIVLEQECCAAGTPVEASTAALARISGCDRRWVADQLRLLARLGLLSVHVPGRRRGPGRDRQPTIVARQIPIPSPRWPADLRGTPA
jgi:hypothetical protein